MHNKSDTLLVGTQPEKKPLQAALEPKEVSMDAAIEAVPAESDGIFTVKEEQRTAMEAFLALLQMALARVRRGEVMCCSVVPSH